MSLSDAILDKAYDIYEEFGPERRTPRSERLKKKIGGLSSGDLDELISHMDRVSKTVWSLAERGGEAKMKKEEIVCGPSSCLSVFEECRIETSSISRKLLRLA